MLCQFVGNDESNGIDGIAMVQKERASKMSDEEKPKMSMPNVFVFCITDKDGNEGVPAFLNTAPGPRGPVHTWRPMFAINDIELAQLKMIATDMEKKVGTPLKLFKFTEREEVLDWKPSPILKPASSLKLL